ncbi:MAG: pirin family protein [Deltaproteobacteria bacterium]|nr:MAG: pirin family protein [Deltaproteobacteria bacterium]
MVRGHDAGPVLATVPLDFQWPTVDPFLFCVHHDDAYPPGNDALGPAAPLTGRRIGMDFDGIDGWRMYHGDVVPGFPRHPHRGFETITIARRGFIDHADSLGATGRFGAGDVQWMTAGRGIVHSEMFPLLSRDAPNPTELFQIWLNLPRADKLVEPHYQMMWRHRIPTARFADESGRPVEVRAIAGAVGGVRPPAPPPHSWAARPDADVAIWIVRMAPGARWTPPPARPGVHRTLYLVRGGPARVAGVDVPPRTGVQVVADADVPIDNGPADAEWLLLQGRPIGEPVAHYGPFVMTSHDEIRDAIADYQRGGFGGWPWPADGPVHPREAGRFAVYAGGRTERPPP